MIHLEIWGHQKLHIFQNGRFYIGNDIFEVRLTSYLKNWDYKFFCFGLFTISLCHRTIQKVGMGILCESWSCFGLQELSYLPHALRCHRVFSSDFHHMGLGHLEKWGGIFWIMVNLPEIARKWPGWANTIKWPKISYLRNQWSHKDG